MNNENLTPNPPGQPAAIPPQQEAQNQAATGLESQPNMAENYTPNPSYQNTAIAAPKMPLRKILLIAVIVILVLGIGAFFLFYFNKGSLSLTVTPNDAEVSIDGAGLGKKQAYRLKLSAGEHVLNINLQDHVPYNNKITIDAYQTKEINLELKGIPLAQKASDEKFEFISASPDEKDILALGNSGKTFYKIPVATSGQKQGETASTPLNISSLEAISEKKLGNIIEVIWNPANSLAILKVKNEKTLSGTDVYKPELKDGITTTWLYDFKRYDLANQEISYLGDNIGDIVWTAKGDQIIYYNSSNRSLYQAGPSNESPKLITKINKISNPQISISPNDKYLTLVPRLTTYSQNFVYLVDLYSKEVKQIVKEGNQKGAIFSPKSDKILYATYTEDPLSSINSLLSITDLNGENNETTNIKTTIENIAFVGEEGLVYGQLDNPNASEVLKKYHLDSKQDNSFYFRSENVIHFNQFVILQNAQKVYFTSEGYLYYMDLISDDYGSE